MVFMRFYCRKHASEETIQHSTYFVCKTVGDLEHLVQKRMGWDHHKRVFSIMVFGVFNTTLTIKKIWLSENVL